MMQAEKVAEDLRDAHEAVAGERSPVPALSAALRRLERRRAQAPALIDPAVKALDAALTALEEARAHLDAALARREPRSARARAHRGAAVRAARGGPQIQCRGRRSRGAAPRDMPPISRRIDAGAEELKRLEASAREAEAAYAQGRGGAVRRRARRRPRSSTRRSPPSSSRSSSSARASSTNIEADAARARTASTGSSSGCRPIRARGRAR